MFGKKNSKHIPVGALQTTLSKTWPTFRNGFNVKLFISKKRLQITFPQNTPCHKRQMNLFKTCLSWEITSSWSHSYCIGSLLNRP